MRVSGLVFSAEDDTENHNQSATPMNEHVQLASAVHTPFRSQYCTAVQFDRFD